jgi:hypothetical protein
MFTLFACLTVSAPASAQRLGESIDITMYGRVTNQYFFRGLLQADRGSMLQGAAEMKVALYDGKDTQFYTVGSFFLSLHPGDQVEGGNVPAAWYEARMTGGLGVTQRGLDVHAQFAAYSSPNGSFQDIYELLLWTRWRDDTYWAGRNDYAVFRGLFPELTLAGELGGARDGRDSGGYLGLGLAPRLRALYGALFAVDFVFPASLGLSLSDYYQTRTGPLGKRENHALGYLSLGALIDIEARWVPRRLGAWNWRPTCELMFPTASQDAVAPRTSTVEFVVRADTVLNF